MKIKKILIRNYRAVDSIELCLNPQMNVLYGANGVGKSTVLYSVFNILNFILRSDRDASKCPVFSRGERRHLDKSAEISLFFSDDRKLTLSGNGDGCVFDGDLEDFNVKLSSFIPNIVNIKIEATQNGDKIDFKLVQQPQMAYTRGLSDYHEFKKSFEELENLENQRKKDNSDYREPILAKIRETITRVTGNLKDLTIDREQEGNPLCVEKFGKLINVEHQLSSGEASIIALIGQTGLDMPDDSSVDHIVIIDEVDNSLHPQWQMKICHILKEAFPNAQFIVTSHSPFVWAGLERKEVIWLSLDENNNVIQKDVDFAKGGSVENIIAKFFETESYDNGFLKELNEVEFALDRRDSKKVDELLRIIEEKYGDIPVISQVKFKMRMLGL